MDKPEGPTSHDVVAAVRRTYATRRVGHAGTLDPMASGVLPVLLGAATRLARFLVGMPKRYEGTIRLGATTDTDDRTGTVVRETGDAAGVPDAAVADAMRDLTGPMDQVPPRYSAKKVGGVPAHRRARRGQDVALAPRPVTVHRFACVGRDGADVHFETEVSSGTYVRALARDLGDRLGCGAHLVRLRRTAVGPWNLDLAVPLDALSADHTPHSPAVAVAHLDRVSLAAADAESVRHGRPVAGEPAGDGPVALFADDALLAVAEWRDGLLRPRVVLSG